MQPIEPRASSQANLGPRSGFDAWIAGFINDPRDVPFVRLALMTTFVTIPFAIALFLPHVFSWPLAAAYVLMNGVLFLDRFILMLHNTSHRPLFRRRYAWLNSWIPWVIGPFFGETPETYYAHHVGMHHLENNLAGDLSSTMKYQRDSLLGFLHYYFSFLFDGLRRLALYLRRKKRARLFNKMIAGELSFYALCVVLAVFVDWRPTLVVFIAPVVVVRFLMMAGNWGQHAFVAADDPGNNYRNSITVIRCRYNDRCFNDGYHIGHHVNAGRHWSEMPSDFEASRAEYARQGALVFEGIDFFGVWALLMLRNYDALAKRIVPLGDERPSHEEIVATLRARTRPFPA
jgi:fatty acid desaturase